MEGLMIGAMICFAVFMVVDFVRMGGPSDPNGMI